MTIAHESPATVALRDRFTVCLLGQGCGDAVGITLEFVAPGTFRPIR